MLKKSTAAVLGLNMLISPALSAAAPAIPGFYGQVALPTVSANTLPQVKLNPDGTQAAVGAVVGAPSGNSLVINQHESRAVIDWSAFNIGKDASVRFNQGAGTPGTASWQPDSSYAALNRIHDANTSQILGSLQADGKVYLINQNGILFGPGSQVNVNSLVGSTLNLKDADFMNGLLHFRSENYQHAGYDPANAAGNLTLPAPDPEAAVANHGNLGTTTGGSVFLLAPVVENGGSITTPQGKAYLVAVRGAGEGATPENSELKIVEYSEPGTLDVRYSTSAVAGSAVNLEGGRIVADSGRVGLYGATVRQDGLIRAVTAVKRGGEIYLAARDRVSTGAHSVTETPVSDSGETADQSFAFSGGSVKIGGLATKTDETSEPVLEPLNRIEHYGAITAPSGEVTLNAVERIFLDTGSSIDVAGLWLERPAEANLLTVQLNSVELKNDYGQKNGELKGDAITVDVAVGSSIGDLSGAYLAREKTAEERSTKGGSVTLGAPELKLPGSDRPYILAELIVKEGAKIDFSGGGIHYAAGALGTTKLASGNKIYDIGSAPQWLKYRNLDYQKFEHQRFGVTEEFKGLYYGGGAPVLSYTPARTVGSDAGQLSVAARKLVLDGDLAGRVTRGHLQTAITAHTDEEHRDYDVSVARGLEEPVGGALLVGRDPGETVASDDANQGGLLFDSAVGDITVKAATASLGEFHADSELTREGAELSAQVLNDAGLSRLGLYGNGSVTTEADASINLMPGGSFSATARRIEHHGELHAAGGSAMFSLRDDVTSHQSLFNPATGSLDTANEEYRPVASTLYFAQGSVVSVSGETIDNSQPESGSGAALRPGRTSGGQITIQDQTTEGALEGNNLVLAQGALLDVSGGYQISQKGKVSGGNAGTVDLRARNLSLAGELRGLALAGKKGGEVKLHAGEIVVGQSGAILPAGSEPDAAPPAEQDGKLLLAQDRFEDSGFTRIALSAVNDVTFAEGVALEPSRARLDLPPRAGLAGGPFQPAPEMAGSAEYLGATSLSATAGAKIYNGPLLDPSSSVLPNLEAKVEVAAGATLKSAPGGKINLTGPRVRVAGELEAPGGSVALKATRGDLELSGSVKATGYLKPDTTVVAGRPAGDIPQSAGSVSLEAAKGSVILRAGSRVDLSGTQASERLVRGKDGAAVAVQAAGDPGELKLSYASELKLDGEIVAGRGYREGVGGTLTVHKNDTESSGLAVSAADVERYQESGFDALTFKNSKALIFEGGTELEVGRSLTLDAPEIRGSGGDVSVEAPWVRLVNSGTESSQPLAPGGGEGRLTVSGEWVDAEGSLALTGFDRVEVAAGRDLRLSDRIYSDPQSSGSQTWAGNLDTRGDLTLKADRIYPTSAADFTINARGKVTILPGEEPDTRPIYSAGGKLTVNAVGGIEQRGVLAAPMGSITLDGKEGRVLLAEGSVTATSAQVPVAYGSYDGTFWTVKDIDQGNKGGEVTGAPEKSIKVLGDEVVLKDGAHLEADGGGSVYTYLYQPGIEGTVNPISGSGRYVILPDNSVQIPGLVDAKGKAVGAVQLERVRLDDGTWLEAGTYSLLPEQYAFLPGALVISELGSVVAPGTQPRTKEGYQVVAGRGTYLGTGIEPPAQRGYAIRSAEQVLREGNFTLRGEVGNFHEGGEFGAGDGGSLAVNGKTTVMAASFQAAPLAGYQPGSMELSGTRITVQETAPELAAEFGFDSAIPEELRGRLELSAQALSGRELSSLKLGNEQETESITVQQGSELSSRNVTLAARDRVTVESGAAVGGLSEDGGSVTIAAPLGEVTVEEGAKLRASNAIDLDGRDLTLKGELAIDDAEGRLGLKSDAIFFVADGFAKGADQHGLFLTENQSDTFSDYQEVALTSRSSVTFLRDADVKVGVRDTLPTEGGAASQSARGTLTLDAGSIAGSTEVSLEAGRIVLRNSGAAAADPAQGTSGSIALKAKEISVAADGGSIAVDGFKTVRLASRNDLTLQGAGSLKTGGDLELSAARVTTSYYRDQDTPYTAADFLIDAKGGVKIEQSGGSAGSVTTPGGNLAIEGRSITQSGTIEVASGQVELTATGSGAGDGIFLSQGAQILARGSKVATAQPGHYEYLSGGRVALNSEGGSLELGAGSLVDVSAAAGGGDAGGIALTAPSRAARLEGELKGEAGTGGRGGSLALDSTSVNLAQLNGKLSAGGFTERLAIRSRQGDLALNAGEVLQGRDVTLTADQGGINVAGRIVADGNGIDRDGGRVELNAGTRLTLESGAEISAQGAGPDGAGGEVALNAAAEQKIEGEYALKVKPGAWIDVSGERRGGSVALRAYRIGNDVNMAGLPGGAIVGADRVAVEAARSYTVNGAIAAAHTAARSGEAPEQSSVYDYDAYRFMNDNGSALKSRLFGAAQSDPDYRLQAGIELRSEAGRELTLASNWDLTSWRYLDQPGVLTLRSGGNLNIQGNLTDHPTARNQLTSATMQDSWGMNLAAGADQGSARTLAVRQPGAGGDLVIADSKAVYSENAPIRFASARDTRIGKGAAAGYMVNGSMAYNLAAYGGAIRGETGRDLALKDGAIQTAVGDVELRVGRDLNLNNAAIRSTGEYAFGSEVETGPGSGIIRQAQMTDYWSYRNGGDIEIEAAGDLAGFVNDTVSSADKAGKGNAWDYSYGGGTALNKKNKQLSASFEGVDSTEGIATMGGGDIAVRTGGSFNSQIGAFGRKAPVDGQDLGQGDLTVTSGGDLNGRFRVTNGRATLTSAGGFGSAAAQAGKGGAQVVELADAQLKVLAQGDVHLGAVLNPDNTRAQLFLDSAGGTWNLTYSKESSMIVASLGGDVTFYGGSAFDGYTSEPSGYDLALRERVLPATVTMAAAGDLNLRNEFALAPSADGNLGLFAGGSIKGGYGDNSKAKLYMTDRAPEGVYGYQQVTDLKLDLDEIGEKSVAHRGDQAPVLVRAGRDIENLQLYLTKKAEVTAGVDAGPDGVIEGGDIRGLVFSGQNIAADDVTSIRAGGDIHYDFLPEGASTGNVIPADFGIQLAGPGALVVQAGRNIELGNSQGIRSTGNSLNPGLGGKGADLVVVAGARKRVDADGLERFVMLNPADAVTIFSGQGGKSDHEDDALNGLRLAGQEYTDLKGKGETELAEERLEQARQAIVRPWFDAPGEAAEEPQGTISMTSSQIGTTKSEDNIYILAQSALNVGKTAFVDSQTMQSTGITTASGGAINIYAGGDVNVNESRVMTFRGGDIMVWSDRGNINAGRGSKTTVNAAPPTLNDRGELVFSPPAVGSGLRALSYDPDGFDGPLVAPDPGDIDIYAPDGEVDAGEAGIAGGKVTIGAVTVANVGNIDAGGGSVGLPAAADSSVSLGALGGAGSVAENGRMIDQVSGLGSAQEKLEQQASAVDDFMSRWLDVKIISFD